MAMDPKAAKSSVWGFPIPLSAIAKTAGMTIAARAAFRSDTSPGSTGRNRLTRLHEDEGVNQQLQDAVRFIVLPLLVVTGIAMWQAPRIRRLRKTVGRTRALDVAPSAPPAEPGVER